MRQMVAEHSGMLNGLSRRKAKCSVIKRELWRLRAHVVARDPSRPSMTGAPSLPQSPQALAWLTCVARQTELQSNVRDKRIMVMAHASRGHDTHHLHEKGEPT
ncbi:MAG: hypothetical protein OJF51_003958 [Nitrospira sp.]|jgi:hypothetical protein|nr:MAG: hypothetical protein OJF51_003958 [Nitrospira sp.]